MLFQFISQAFICALLSIFQIVTISVVEWWFSSILNQFLKLLLVLLSLNIDQIVIHPISYNLASNSLLVVCEVLLGSSLHVASHICLVYIMENALVLLVLCLSDLYLSSSFLWLFFYRLDGTVKMLDLRKRLGATWGCQVVVRITMKAKLVRHLYEVDYLVVIDCWRCCIIHTEQVFNFSQLFSRKVDLELQTSCIESSNVDCFSSIWIGNNLSQNIFPLISYFISDDLFIIFQTFEIKWCLWLLNLDDIVIPEIGSRALWFISLFFVHGAVNFWSPRIDLLLLDRLLWLLNIVVKTELN